MLASQSLRSLLLGAALLLCGALLQGCGKSNDDGPAATTTTATTTGPPPAPAPAPARKASEVVNVPGWPDIGSKFPLSWAVKAGGMVYVSGGQGMDIGSMKIVPGGALAETSQIIQNLATELKAANSSLKNVVRCSVSLVNMTRDFDAVNQAFEAYWPTGSTPPARVALEVEALAGNASVEIQCDAALDSVNRSAVVVKGFPAPAFLSMAVAADGMIYLSGMAGFKTGEAGPKLVEGGVANETAQALQNIKTVLAAAGSTPERVVACSVAVTNLSDFEAVNAVYRDFWPAHGVLGGLPSRVGVQVRKLAMGASVEITCTAAGTSVTPNVVNPGWPASKMPFSAGTTAAGIVYISGNQGFDMKTHKRVTGGVHNETTQTLLNIKAVAEAGGSSMEDVVACEVSLATMADFAAMNAAYKEFWHRDPPSRVAVQVGVQGGGAVEIRCMAALPGNQRDQVAIVL